MYIFTLNTKTNVSLTRPNTSPFFKSGRTRCILQPGEQVALVGIEQVEANALDSVIVSEFALLLEGQAWLVVTLP